MVNQRDVAKLAGVSSATVSKYINRVGYISPDLKARIEKTIEKLDYQPNLVARNLKMKISNTIGMIFPDIENDFFISLITKAEEIAFKQGYSIILCNTQNNPEKEKYYVKILKGRIVDGYIIITSFNDRAYLEKAMKKEKVVYLDRNIGIKGQILVKLDNVKGAETAIDYLTDLGHKKIGLLNVSTGITPGAERYKGYLKALKKKKIKPDSDLIRISDFTVEDSIKKTQDILELKKRPTAILSISDRVTIGALKAIKNLGMKIPDDISIIGFDDFKTSELLNPPLTAVVQPAYEFGEVGINTLIKIIGGQKLENKTIILEPKFVIRKSCRRI